MAHLPMPWGDNQYLQVEGHNGHKSQTVSSSPLPVEGHSGQTQWSQLGQTPFVVAQTPHSHCGQTQCSPAVLVASVASLEQENNMWLQSADNSPGGYLQSSLDQVYSLAEAVGRSETETLSVEVLFHHWNHTHRVFKGYKFMFGILSYIPLAKLEICHPNKLLDLKELIEAEGITREKLNRNIRMASHFLGTDRHDKLDACVAASRVTMNQKIFYKILGPSTRTAPQIKQLCHQFREKLSNGETSKSSTTDQLRVLRDLEQKLGLIPPQLIQSEPQPQQLQCEDPLELLKLLEQGCKPLEQGESLEPPSQSQPEPPLLEPLEQGESLEPPSQSQLEPPAPADANAEDETDENIEDKSDDSGEDENANSSGEGEGTDSETDENDDSGKDENADSGKDENSDEVKSAEDENVPDSFTVKLRKKTKKGISQPSPEKTQTKKTEDICGFICGFHQITHVWDQQGQKRVV